MRKNVRKRKKDQPDGIVAAVQARSVQAAALASITGQERLADPRTNPAVRGQADRLRDEQQGAVLVHQHRRVLRRVRVADTRAAEAERALEALAVARQISSPARSVLALHRGRRFYLRLSLAASLVLAAGSARGVDAVAQAMGAPAGTGYIAEIGLTGLTTVAIAYRSHLAEHGGRPADWQGRVLWALMVVPLLLSAVANAVKAGPIGIACALGAGAFALFGYIIADQSNRAMLAKAGQVTATDEDQLRAAAMGDEEVFAPVAGATTTADVIDIEDLAEGQADAPGASGPAGITGSAAPGTQAELVEAVRAAVVEAFTAKDNDDSAEIDDEVDAEVAQGLMALQTWLDDPDDPQAGRSAEPPAADDGPTGTALTLPEPGSPASQAGGAHTVDQGAHTDADRAHREGEAHGSGRGGEAGSDRVAAATAARRNAGAWTRFQIAALLTQLPHTTTATAAEALGVSLATVKRHRAALREAGFEEMNQQQRQDLVDGLRVLLDEMTCDNDEESS